jgi:hypothetical protein
MTRDLKHMEQQQTQISISFQAINRLENCVVV